jgi:hypothetical protein
MIATRPDKPICLPPAPLNGGPLDESTPPKVGRWAWHPKIDDRRVVIHAPSRTIWNQYGQLSVAQDSEKFEPALDRLEQLSFAAEWLDAGLMEYRHDMMRGTIVIFDLITDGPFEERRAMLEDQMRGLDQTQVRPMNDYYHPWWRYLLRELRRDLRALVWGPR